MKTRDMLVAVLFLTANTSHATEWSTNLPIFSGGSFDGWDRQSMTTAAALGDSEISFYSVSDQFLSWTDASVALEQVAIEVSQQGDPIAITNNATLRISVPAAWGCRFDTDAALSFGGAAASKINTSAVSYPGSGRTLQIPVTGDFLDGDILTVSGLTLLDLRLGRQGWRRLELAFGPADRVDVYDARVLILGVLHAGGSFDGWDRSAMSAAAGLGGAEVAFSSGMDQMLSWIQPHVELEPLTLEVVSEGDPMVIIGGGSLKVRVPAAWACRFDATAPLDFGGSAAAKINTSVSYADGNRTLVIPVTDDFLTSDTLVISGLALLDLALCRAGAQRLELDFDGDGIMDVSDAFALILSVLHPGGSFDGWDRDTSMEYQEIWQPAGTLFMVR